MRPINRLSSALSPRAHGDGDGPAHLRYGVITAVHTSPSTVDVEIDNKSPAWPNCAYLGWYTPVVGHVVECLVTGSDCLVLGRQAIS